MKWTWWKNTPYSLKTHAGVTKRAQDVEKWVKKRNTTEKGGVYVNVLALVAPPSSPTCQNHRNWRVAHGRYDMEGENTPYSLKTHAGVTKLAQDVKKWAKKRKTTEKGGVYVLVWQCLAP